MAKKKEKKSTPIKLNLGSGPNKIEGFLSVDCISFPGVDVITDLTKKFPWEDNTVEEIHAAHVIEHFDAIERIHFINEIYRILIPGGKATIAAPHWASCRAYGDPTHKFPPISEFWFFYLSRDWRLGNEEKKIQSNAPHTDAKYMKGGFNCDFDATWGYTLHPTVQLRNQEAQQFMVQFYKDAALDIVATLIKK